MENLGLSKYMLVNFTINETFVVIVKFTEKRGKSVEFQKNSTGLIK